MFRSILLLTILTLVGVFSLAQEPAYFVLGQDELANTDIYSIIEGDEGGLYISSNDGLLCYRNGSYSSIPFADAQNNGSLFSLVKDNEGEIYCCNLRGQIFKVENDSLRLFYALDRSLLGPTISIIATDQNEIIVASRGLVNCSLNRVLYQKSGQYTSGLFRLPDRRIAVELHTESCDSLVFIEEGEVKFLDISEMSQKSDRAVRKANERIVLLDGKLSLLKDDAIDFLENKQLVNKVASIEGEVFVQTGENEIIARGLIAGVRILSVKNQTLEASKVFLKDYKISALHVNDENVKYFGTFGNGVIVVPNQNMEFHKLSSDNKRLLNVATGKGNNLFVSQQSVGIIHYDELGVKKIIDGNPTTALQNIFYTPGIAYDVHEDYPSLYYLTDSLVFPSSVKDVFQVSSGVVFAAASKGIFCFGSSIMVKNQHWNRVGKRGIYIYNLIDERCSSIVIDKRRKSIYVGTQSGLIKVDSNGVMTKLTYKGLPIQAMDLEYHNGRIWCATKTDGLLVFEGNTLVHEVNSEKGLLDDRLKKICFRDSMLFILQDKHCQLYNLQTEQVFTLGIAEGLTAEQLNDITISKDYLWLLSNTGLFSIPIEKLPSSNYTPELSIDSIVFSGKGRTYWSENGKYHHKNNHFKAYLNYRHIASESQVYIDYRIIGFEENWNTVDVKKPMIEYKALPPGKFSFEAKVRYGNVDSQVLTHHFQIKAPYWMQWWFIPLIIFLTIAIISTFYWNRIRTLRRKSADLLEKQKIQADLLETELKALRSQMNPHFIFNSLNSIQDLILKEKTDESYDYIVLFAELVRSTLNYSNQDFIPIQKEIEFLNVYLSLEKLRFKDEFTYQIDYSGPTHIEVPSLIIQPFIENALVHGLLHKEGHKNLKVEFIFKEHLVCVVTDNGIGRKKSKEIQKRQGGQHNSFALGAIRKRLAILAKKYGDEVGFVVHDICEEESTAGTSVHVTIPHNRKI